MGPIPDIEEGVELDWNKVRVGGVKVPAQMNFKFTFKYLDIIDMPVIGNQVARFTYFPIECPQKLFVLIFCTA